MEGCSEPIVAVGDVIDLPSGLGGYSQPLQGEGVGSGVSQHYNLGHQDVGVGAAQLYNLGHKDASAATDQLYNLGHQDVGVGEGADTGQLYNLGHKGAATGGGQHTDVEAHSTQAIHTYLSVSNL